MLQSKVTQQRGASSRAVKVLPAPRGPVIGDAGRTVIGSRTVVAAALSVSGLSSRLGSPRLDSTAEKSSRMAKAWLSGAARGGDKLLPMPVDTLL